MRYIFSFWNLNNDYLKWCVRFCFWFPIVPKLMLKLDISWASLRLNYLVSPATYVIVGLNCCPATAMHFVLEISRGSQRGWNPFCPTLNLQEFPSHGTIYEIIRTNHISSYYWGDAKPDGKTLIFIWNLLNILLDSNWGLIFLFLFFSCVSYDLSKPTMMKSLPFPP